MARGAGLVSRAVCICGPDRGSPLGDSRMMALVSLALVQGYDPVVVALDPDAARMVEIMGGEFWAIEVPAPGAYVAEVAQAYAAWESETLPGTALKLRRSRLWERWQEVINDEIRTPRSSNADRN